MRYIVETVEDFFAKLDRMQQELAKFSQEIDDRNSGSYRNFGFMFVNSDIVFNNDLTISSWLHR